MGLVLLSLLFALASAGCPDLPVVQNFNASKFLGTVSSWTVGAALLPLMRLFAVVRGECGSRNVAASC